MLIAYRYDTASRLRLAFGFLCGLAGARRVKLVTRFDRPEPGNLTGGIYVQWRQPKFHKRK